MVSSSSSSTAIHIPHFGVGMLPLLGKADLDQSTKSDPLFLKTDTMITSQAGVDTSSSGFLYTSRIDLFTISCC